MCQCSHLPVEHLGTAQGIWDRKLAVWHIALPEVPCVSKMLIAYLASFLGVLPFRETQDPMVDTRLDTVTSSGPLVQGGHGQAG
jgi:hypothetical protein